MSETAFRSQSWRQRLLLGGTVLFFGMLLFCPDKTTPAVSEGMTVFTKKLVPVLFPYMVLSHFFCTYKLLDPLAELLPIGHLFRMDTCAFTVFVLGHLCGYPVGAKMTAESVHSGNLSPRQGAVLCAASGGASPAFLLHIVGGMLWGDIRLGMLLFGCQVVFGLAAGWLLGRPIKSNPVKPKVSSDPVPLSRCFCEAVSGSALQLVSVGGYIVFFTLLTALLPFGGTAGASFAAVLEFSTGVRISASLGGYRGLFLTGFAVGFGGLSVLAQTAHMLSGSGVSLRIYVGCKICAGFFCGLAAVCYGLVFPDFSLCRNVTAGPAPVGCGTDLVWFTLGLGIMWYFSMTHRAAEQ